MVAAFGTAKPRKRDLRLITDYPRLDRGTLKRAGALEPGMRTSWAVKAGPGAAAALSVELTALPDGLVLKTGDRVQVVRYHYDKVPCGSLRQLFWCSCGSVCRAIFFGGSGSGNRWGCQRCLQLTHPIRSSGRIAAAYQVADLRRELIEARPGSPRGRQLLAQIAEHHAILTADVARIRRDLRKRLKRNHKRTIGESPVRAEPKSQSRSDAGDSD